MIDRPIFYSSPSWEEYDTTNSDAIAANDSACMTTDETDAQAAIPHGNRY